MNLLRVQFLRTALPRLAAAGLLCAVSSSGALFLSQCSSSSGQGTPAADSGSATDGGGADVTSGGDSGNSPGDAAEGGGGTLAEITALCTTFWTARCGEYQSCLGDAFATQYVSAADCASERVPACASQYTSDATTVTPTTLSACFSAYGTLACGDFIQFLDDPSYLQPAACAAIKGTRAADAGCAFDTECAGGRCNPGINCGQCTTRADAGGACATSGDCAYGLACRGSQCVARVALGGTCTATAPCDVDLLCSTAGTCVALLDAGATCDPNAPSETCNFPDEGYCDSTSSTCKIYPTAGAGQPCGYLYSDTTQSYSYIGDCSAGLRCAQNATRAFCIPETTAGQGCLLASGPGIVTPPPPSQCDDKDKCVAGLCVPVTAQSCEGYVPPQLPTGTNPGNLPAFPNLGGSVMNSVDYVSVTFPGYPYPSVNTMADYIFSSGWIAKVAGEYGLVGGQHTASVTLTDLLTGDLGPDGGVDTITNEQLQYFLVQEIKNGKLPTPAPYTPGHGTVYAVHLPVEVVVGGVPYGTTCQANGGYHDIVISPYEFAYTVIPNCGPDNQGHTAEQVIQSTIAHELIESMSDPALNMSRAWILDQPNPWNATGGEIADLCEYNYETEGGFFFQRIYSSKAAVAGTDPCLPQPTPANYYSMVGPETSTGAAGATVHIPVTAWVSGAAPSSWSVDAYNRNSTVTGSPSVSLDQTTMTASGTANIVVQIPSTATSGQTITSVVESWVDGSEDHIWVNQLTVQ